jgi:hypothetical protein
MPSEAERITYEVMDRRGIGKLLPQPDGAEPHEVERGCVPEVGPDFVNDGYMELERPSGGWFR